MTRYVLIVEDSPAMRSFIASAIEALNDFQIVETSNGFEALKVLPRYKFDLILTDINMPDINGLELVSFVKKSTEYSHIPLVIITTEGSEKDQQKGLALGADAYLVKPFKVEVLQKVLKSYLH